MQRLRGRDEAVSGYTDSAGNPLPAVGITQGDGWVDDEGRFYKRKTPKGHITRGVPGVVAFGVDWDTYQFWRCKSCVWFVVKRQSGRYFKCELLKQGTSAGSDIRANDPGCARFVPASGDNEAIREFMDRDKKRRRRKR